MKKHEEKRKTKKMSFDQRSNKIYLKAERNKRKEARAAKRCDW